MGSIIRGIRMTLRGRTKDGRAGAMSRICQMVESGVYEETSVPSLSLGREQKLDVQKEKGS